MSLSVTMCEYCGLLVEDVPNPKIEIKSFDVYVFLSNLDNKGYKAASYNLCPKCRKEAKKRLKTLLTPNVSDLAQERKQSKRK